MDKRDIVTVLAALLGTLAAAVAAFLGAYWLYFNRGTSTESARNQD